jgi:hypothetical protein
MSTHEEERIRQLFREAREADAREAPPFGSVLSSERSGSRWRVRSWAVAAAPVALCLALVVFWISEKDPPATPPLSVTTFYWQSPTEVYLMEPGEGVLSYVAAETAQSSGSEP